MRTIISGAGTALLCLLLAACDWFLPPPKITYFTDEPPKLAFETLWSCPALRHNGYNPPLIKDGVFYSPQANGIMAVELASGRKLWESGMMNGSVANVLMLCSPMLAFGDYLLFSAKTWPDGTIHSERWNLWLLNRHTGARVGRARLVDPAAPELLLHSFHYSIVENNGRVVLPIVKGGWWNSERLGYCTFQFDPECFSMGDEPGQIEIELLYPFAEYQKPSMQPVWSGSVVYLLLSGAGWLGPRPPGKEAEPGYYEQEVVRLVAIDMELWPTNRPAAVLWERGFSYVGSGISKYSMHLVDGILYIADELGLAAVNAANGSLVYEKSINDPSNATDYSVPFDGLLYMVNCNRNISAWRLRDGEKVWEGGDINYTRIVSPVLYGDRLYMADPDGLRVFNRHTGEIIGMDESLGMPGDREGGTLLTVGDILYLPLNQSLTAVRMGSERLVE